MGIKIGIVDDERPARSELRHQLMQLLPGGVIQEGDSGAAALEMAEREKYDLFFLDINLGDINGTVLVNALRTMQPDMKIIFVTAYGEYAVKAFELGVDDYVLKPYDKKRLEKVISKCCKEQETEGQKVCTSRLAISTGSKTIFEDIENIAYIETCNRGCMIHASGKEYYEGKTIGEYEKKLGGGRFYRCHKSYLISLDKVKEVFPWGNNSFGVKMEGWEENILPVGREKVKVLRQLLGW